MAQQMPTPRPASRIAVTVMDVGSGLAPCPFFGKCDGIVVLDSNTGAREFHGNPSRTPKTLCDVILASGADGLVCGFVAEPEILRLRAAGIDVRVGSGRCSVDELATCFCDLPPA
ncbi:MAG: NifB/NifX family molybdenum-iron cluster-binding protein [Gammaproteobacteria bacterium]